jgi:transposase
MVKANKLKASKSGKNRRPYTVHKPNGVLSPRVQAVGPKHFGIVAVDPAKGCSKWMLCDFYGNVLVPPVKVDHSKLGFDMAVLRLREAVAQHTIKDIVIAIERTGEYHLPVKHAFSNAGFPCRIVHPFATKRFRDPANPGNKTDENDLVAIVRAAQSGFALSEQPWDAVHRRLQLLARHRRNLVERRAAVYCQIREHLDAFLPGYAACFSDLWENGVALPLARRFASAEALKSSGAAGLAQPLRQAGVRFQTSSLNKVIAWTYAAPAAGPDPETHQRILRDLDDERIAKTTEIHELEREIAALLVQTPYVLLLAVPGINVVSAGELAGEMGPIEHYANAKAITGRAGLFPSRYQSDDVDHPNGSLIRCANRTLRAALLLIAGNLAVCNHYFMAKVEVWRRLDKDELWMRVKIASIFSRIAYQIVAGQNPYNHPFAKERNYILEKLITFHREHGTDAAQLLLDLEHAGKQLPECARRQEAVPLEAILNTTKAARKRGPQLLGDILPIVLAKLGAGTLQSNASGETTPANGSRPSAE